MPETIASPTRRALPILALIVVLLWCVVVTLLYFLAIFVSPGSGAAIAQTGILEALGFTMLCVAPLAMVSIPLQIGQWRLARFFLAASLLAGLGSVGFFIVILDRFGYF